MAQPPSTGTGTSTGFTTPTKRPAFAATANADAGPSRARPSGASPAYSSRRHSLYGVEDRVIIDPGSRIWKVGYSGEYDPRAVFWTRDSAAPDTSSAEEDGIGSCGIWELDLARTAGAKGDRVEAGRLVDDRILRLARDVYIRHLKTDPKTRKVIILEPTFMPDHVKQALAKAFFDNLRVPSVAFTSASVLALAACGRATGLVVDVGWLETTVTPVYHSRPLYHAARSTPLAGQALYRRLSNLLNRYGTYTPPPQHWSAPLPQASRVPSDVLTDRLMERIISEACFASGFIPQPWTGAAGHPPSAGPDEGIAGAEEAARYDSLKERYLAHCDARDVSFAVPTAEGARRLHVPGWVRERAVEVLFGDDDSEDDPVQHVILSVVAKLPIDLRPTMLSSILITGGTASMPGFIPKLRDSLLHTLAQSNTNTPSTAGATSLAQHRITSPEFRAAETKAWRYRHLTPYASLAPLRRRLVVLNDPCPLDTDQRADSGRSGVAETQGSDVGEEASAVPVNMRGGKVPRWTPGLMSWVGGSLAGALKTGGPELTREEYDTRAAIDAERSAAYQAALEAEAEAAAQAQAEAEAEAEAASQAAAGQRTSAVADDTLGQTAREPYSGRIIQGVQLEDLLPGMALIGASRRKRGWRGQVGLHDWSRALRT